MSDVSREALLWCLDHFEALDRSNACMHLAPVRYSPITFRVAQALEADWPVGEDITEAMATIRHHQGAYELDPGR